jgi:hypothetical protein
VGWRAVRLFGLQSVRPQTVTIALCGGRPREVDGLNIRLRPFQYLYRQSHNYGFCIGIRFNTVRCTSPCPSPLSRQAALTLTQQLAERLAERRTHRLLQVRMPAFGA